MKLLKHLQLQDDSANKRRILIVFVAALIQFAIFKFLYPYPDFISDSYNYLETCLKNLPVNLWPVGYPRFLTLLHFISPSHLFLTAVQYLLIQASLLYFYFSILALYPLSRLYTRILFAGLFFNPLFLVLANCVLSDAIFTAITLWLFTQYLWMLKKPHPATLIIQAVLIGIAFTMRYTAIYYPVVSIAAILLSGYKPLVKLAGIAAPWLLILPFIFYTQQKTKEVTGTPEFSVFGGWQMANNALYMYNYIEVDSTEVPAGTEALDRAAKLYFKNTFPTAPPIKAIQGTFFIKVPNAILKPYQAEALKNKKVESSLQAWGIVSPVYKAYGTWLIKKYPLAFARHYLWLNTENYLWPYLEKFGSYNIGQRTVGRNAVKWFNLESNVVTLRTSIGFPGYIYGIFPLLFLLLNIAFVFLGIAYLRSKTYKTAQPFVNKTLLLTTVFLLVNFGFSIFATPVVLRYQIIALLLLLCYCLVLLQYLRTGATIAEPAR